MKHSLVNQTHTGFRINHIVRLLYLHRFQPLFCRWCDSHLSHSLPKQTAATLQPPQLPGSPVRVPAPRLRQRRGRALWLRCSPQQQTFDFVWWWFRRTYNTPTWRHKHWFHQSRATEWTKGDLKHWRGKKETLYSFFLVLPDFSFLCLQYFLS